MVTILSLVNEIYNKWKVFPPKANLPLKNRIATDYQKRKGKRGKMKQTIFGANRSIGFVNGLYQLQKGSSSIQQ